MSKEKRQLSKDSDMRYAYEYNSPSFPFKLDEINDVLAHIPGHNDEESWYWVVQLKNGDYYLVSAWCDYTGWDCQSGAECIKAASAEDACNKAEDHASRAIKEQLFNQVLGKQPYGVEDR